MKINIIGAGLAGSECAIQLAKNGYEIKLFDMKPEKKSPAHELEGPAEIVCSNSLGAEDITTGAGLFKEEMNMLGVELTQIAKECRVKAGRALAVDRKMYSDLVKKRLQELGVDIISKEVLKLPEDGINVIATGPLTSEDLAEDMKNYFGDKKFFFYDAIAPVIEKDSIDMSKAFIGGRYQKDSGDYINCPFTKEEYFRFYDELIKAEQHEIKDFEKKKFFESCMPIEEIARRGPKTPLFGPMRPVGFENYIDFEPYAVLQLRQDDMAASMYNMVGFQTNLKYGEQKRVFRLIPGLEKANFIRYGQMHKNIYVNSPQKLNKDLSIIGRENIFLAGQITGVEGYVESIFTGFYVAQCIINKKNMDIPEKTMCGAIIKYITEFSGKNFQPMNANFGLLPRPVEKIRDKKQRKQVMAESALEVMKEYIKSCNEAVKGSNLVF